MQYNTSEHKSSSDEFEELSGTSVRIIIAGYGKTITRKLVSISEAILSLAPCKASAGTFFFYHAISKRGAIRMTKIEWKLGVGRFGLCRLL